jgi:transaldolase
MTKLTELKRFGQSVWYDNIRRALIDSGGLQALLDDGVMGITSNPSIFEKAISENSDYDEAIGVMTGLDMSTELIYEILAFEDIQRTADLLRPIYERTGGIDGYVSLEVNPALAHDSQGTISEARRLFVALRRPNVMIKVPATPAGAQAIEVLIGEGINVNATLIFSLAHYEAVAEAFLAGLEWLESSGGDLSWVTSVASFFVSRVDMVVDQALAAQGNTTLQGEIAIANAKVAYSRFRELFSSARWNKLSAQGARLQRPLWASTSTKNPAYPDTLYVEALIGPDTVNTIPPATLNAFRDHGTIAATLDQGLDQAKVKLEQLANLGVNLEAITQHLQDAGVASFADSFYSLINSVDEKKARLQNEQRLTEVI